MDSLYKELRNKNIEFIGEVINEPYGKVLIFESPDGHWFEFLKIVGRKIILT
ncbi:hypothetical protein [Leeuwenhoekiella aestuarii]|uniref:hypothetical protein n=1 Tax=Leeuwenhoekiella aestuarii TaxID=2249426 RepID=UPI003B835068